MSKSTQPIPTGHESLIPHLVCSPCAEAIEFYKKAFGAEEVGRRPGVRAGKRRLPGREVHGSRAGVRFIRGSGAGVCPEVAGVP